MIRRDTDKGWILITQHDHAVLAYELMKYWGNGDFMQIERSEEVLFAIRQHDSGWKRWDSRAWLYRDNGYPRNFMEMFVNDQFVIWSESFESQSDLHRYGSALIAMHFSKFNNKTLTKNPDSGASKVLKRKINEFVKSMMDIETPDDDSIYGTLPNEFVTNLKLLQFGDILSLALCHGWSSTKIDEVPLNYLDDEVTIEISTEDGINFEVDPYPFNTDEIKAGVPGRKIDQKEFETQKELDDAFNNSRVENLEFSITAKKRSDED